MAIFLDTGFYLGSCHPKDKNAEPRKRIFKQLSEGVHGPFFILL